MRFILNLIGNIKINFDNAFRVVISHSQTIVYVLFYARIFCDSHLKDYSVNIKSLQAMLVLLFKANLPVKNISQPLKVVLMIRIYHICNTSRCRVSLY